MESIEKLREYIDDLGAELGSLQPVVIDLIADVEREIADELNAALGSGTCEFSTTTDNTPTCSNCGWQADAYDCDWLDGGAYEYDGRFCKHCGARVKGVE